MNTTSPPSLPAAEPKPARRAYDRRLRASHRSKPVKAPRLIKFQAEARCGCVVTAWYDGSPADKQKWQRITKQQVTCNDCCNDPDWQARARADIDRMCAGIPDPVKCRACGMLTPDHSDCCEACRQAERRAA